MLYIFVFNSLLQSVAKHYDQAFRNSTSNCVPIYYVNYGSKATSSLFTKKKKKKSRNHSTQTLEIILPKRYPYFNKMTSCIKPAIFSKLDVTDRKASSRCSALLAKFNVHGYHYFQAVSSFLFSHMMWSFNAFNLVFLFTGSTRSPL